ncbi:Non-specific serine/threonine protein kinase [Lentibacillus sp. JNUCC-1]|uniref:DEAD/DEAH box helicase n=1 Tax=Lentibacillus sp. JNUCC-1 TaxID=2654513 RepID=UPI0012E6F945|nr:DEAD/DEAH box helicase [Lentibacillus sp. JNUCC-1]MUV37501.1 Non-specific serine/threonine protein kinase [Lentibacillus sp. JNUCC-1]
MNAISNLNIQRLFPDQTFRRGFDYYRRNLVSDLKYDRNFELWTAIVSGTEDYFVEIDTSDLGNGILKTRCECPAYATYDSCKHVVAALLSIANDDFQDPSVLKYKMTNRFMEAVSRTNEASRGNLDFKGERVPMHVEYILKQDHNDRLQLEMKAGAARLYVVKNIGDFLEHILQEPASYTFTKTFAYSSEEHYFLEQDRAIFQILNAIIQNEELYRGDIPYYLDTWSSSKRRLTIPPLVVHELLSLLSERDVKLETNEGSYEDISMVTGDLPLQFALQKNAEDDLVLDVGRFKEMEYFSDYKLLFYNGTFHRPDNQQLALLDSLYDLGQISGELPVPAEQADAFVSEVLPSLKKLGSVGISDDVARGIVQKPLKAKLFLDLEEAAITGNLEYHYGHHLIHPFQDDAERDVMIVRDVEQEQKIMQLIEYANFRYNGRHLYIQLDEDDLYVFLYEILPVLDEHVELYLTTAVQNLIVDNAPSPTTRVSVDAATNLLEIGFDLSGIDQDEVTNILDAVIEKKRYYRMKNGGLLSLETNEFESVGQLFADLNIDKGDIQDGRVEMPVYRSTQVDELIDTKKSYDPSFQKLLHQLKAPEEQVYDLPDNLNATLRNYQITGYQWFKSLSHYHLGGILADDMGLGKTLQTIAYLLSEPKEHPHLIVVPSSVVYNWKNECDKFAPDLEVAIMTGTPQERLQKLTDRKDADVWIVSYGTLRQDFELYQEQTFQTMILDEAQYIKNYATKTSRAIRQIKAGRRFALTGTPIENSIDELWAIFQVILPGLMPNQRAFRQLSHEKVAALTRPFILRRLKRDVLTELPEKIETVHHSELTDEQRNLYVGYLRKLQSETAASLQQGGFNQNRMKILAGLTRLRQICCHPALFMENYTGHSGKLEQLLETVENAKASGRRMLIFSQFTSMHEIIMKALDTRDIDYFYLHGGTNSEARVEMSNRFNDGEKDVFLISLKAGGTGLNLTGADTVILYDLWWNPAVEDQAAGRAHRFGQKNVVQVIRLISEGTIEEKIYELQQKKRELIDQVIQPGETMLSSLSEDDVRELLSI